MTQDDAHIFCTKEQMADELRVAARRSCSTCSRDYGLDDFYLELSTKPEGKAVGTDEEWDEATEALRVAALEMDLDLVMDEGGGAFYGPKISVQARDAIGRTWQVSTIQVDFQIPQRFELEYVGADNERHRPIMIHRALFGSIERFFAILVEHYAGAFPAWLAPVQVTVLPVADRHDEYAREGRRPAPRRGLPRRDRRRARRHARRARPAGEAREGAVRAGGRRRRRRAGTVGVNARGRERARAGRRRRRVRRTPRARGRRRACTRDPRPAVGGLARDLHRDVADPSLRRRRVPVLPSRRGRSRRGARPRARRARVRGDERVPVHVGAPDGRARCGTRARSPALPREEATALMALTQDATVAVERAYRPTASTSA